MLEKRDVETPLFSGLMRQQFALEFQKDGVALAAIRGRLQQSGAQGALGVVADA